MAWDAALKLTGVRLELLDNEEMYTFIERSIRGGISQISKRFAKANNSRCKDYDPLKPITHLIYLDPIICMAGQMLPIGKFQWLTKDEIDSIDIKSLADDSKIGYIFEVDLVHPHYLHNKHNDYPLAPEKLDIDETMLLSSNRNFQKIRRKNLES